MAGLSPRQQQFVRLYLENGGNATLAYKGAGYKAANANVAAASASALLRIPKVASAISGTRGAKEVAATQATVATLLDCETKLTKTLFGSTHAEDIADLENDLSEMRDERKALRLVREANGLSREALAGISMSIANLTESILTARLQIKTLKLKQEAQQDAAATTLMKAKGVFDPRNPAVTDVGALLNATLRNIIDAKVPVPPTLVEWMKEAEDAVFSIGAGDAEDAAKAPAGGAAAANRPVLFTRAVPKPASP